MHEVNIHKNMVTISGETSTFKYMAFFESEKGFSLEDGVNRIFTSSLDGGEYDPSHEEVARRELTQWVGENLEVLQVVAGLSSKLESESTVAALAARLEAKVEACEGSKKIVFEKPS